VEEQVQGLIKLAFDKYTLLTAGGIFFLLRCIHQIKAISSQPLWRRILPVMPEILGCCAAFLGGMPVVSGKPAVIKIASGLWAGFLAQRFHKVLGQTILGDDRAIEIPKRKPIEPPREEESQ
jgi:hypothetical protein